MITLIHEKDFVNVKVLAKEQTLAGGLEMSCALIERLEVTGFNELLFSIMLN
jgi:hypothetical protein